jgi:hypothetical protein
MIIFGTRGRIKEVGSGEFICPSCRANRQYKRKQAGRYFTLYFIPIFKVKDLGEFVECQTCGGTFKTAVLDLMKTTIVADSAPKAPTPRPAGSIVDDSSEGTPRA